MNKKRKALATLSVMLSLSTSQAREPISQVISETPAAQIDAPVLTVNTVQTIIGTPGESPRLTSVGQELQWGTQGQDEALRNEGIWFSGDQELTLEVEEKGTVKLKLTSPALDPQDYRSAQEYGDERYGGKTVTHYRLRQGERVIHERTYHPSGLAEDTFFEGQLNAGSYTLEITTSGKAKNAFALQASGAIIEARRVNVNILSKNWVTLATLNRDAQDRILAIYDTDGQDELQLRLKEEGQEQSDEVALSVPEGRTDLDLLQATIPADRGPFVLQARQTAQAKQHSNTIGIAILGRTVTVVPPAPESQPIPPKAPESVQVEFEEPVTEESVPVIITPVQPAKPAQPEPVAKISRKSQVVVEVTGKTENVPLILVWRPPAGSQIENPMARTLDGQQIKIKKGAGPDGQDAWYFELPQHQSVPKTARTGVVVELRHENALGELARPVVLSQAGEQVQVLRPGWSNQPEADWKTLLGQLKTLTAPEVQSGQGVFPDLKENQVFIQGIASFKVRLYQNGKVTLGGKEIPEDRISQRIPGEDSKGRYEEISFVAVPLQIGENQLSAEGETLMLLAPGPAAGAEFKAEKTGHEVKVLVRAIDEKGRSAPLSSITLDIKGAQPLTADASMSNAGFQLSLKEGQGELRLRPTGQKVEVRAYDAQGKIINSGALELSTIRNDKQLISMTASATLWFSGLTEGQGEALSLTGRGSAEISIGKKGPYAGELRVNADEEGIGSSTNPILGNIGSVEDLTHLTYGDQSMSGNPLPASGKISGSYDSPALSARYSSGAANDTLFGVGYSSDGLRAQWKPFGEQTTINGYAARIGSQTLSLSEPSNQTIIKLPGGVIRGSEQLTLTGRDEQGQLHNVRLTRGLDYSVDTVKGEITLSRPVRALRPELRGEDNKDPTLQVRYQPKQEQSSPLAWGVSVKHNWERDTEKGFVEAGYAKAPSNAEGELASVIGARAEISSERKKNENGQLSVKGEMRVSHGQAGGQGGVDIQAGVSLQEKQIVNPISTPGLGSTQQGIPTSAQLRVRYQAEGYRGPEEGQAGWSASAGGQLGLSKRFGVKASSNWYAPLGSKAKGEHGVELLWAPLPEHPLWKTLTLGAGMGYSDTLGLNMIGEINSEKPGISFKHEQSLTQSGSRTRFKIGAPALGEGGNVQLSRTSITEDGDVNNQTELAIEGQTLGARYQVSYQFPISPEVPGVITGTIGNEWSVSPTTSIGARLSSSSGTTGNITTAGVEIRHQENKPEQETGHQAMIGIDLRHAPAGLSLGLRSRARWQQDPWTFQEDGRSLFGAEPGHAYSFGAAYRGDRMNAALTAKFASGSLGNEMAIKADGSYAIWRPQTKAKLTGLDLRLGGEARSGLEQSTINWRAYSGATAWVTDRLGFGAIYRISGQEPWKVNTPRTWQHALGLEATGVLFPGLGVTAGYNFTNSGAFRPQDSLHKGLYLRLDALLGGFTQAEINHAQTVQPEGIQPEGLKQVTEEQP